MIALQSVTHRESRVTSKSSLTYFITLPLRTDLQSVFGFKFMVGREGLALALCLSLPILLDVEIRNFRSIVPFQQALKTSLADTGPLRAPLQHRPL